MRSTEEVERDVTPLPNARVLDRGEHNVSRRAIPENVLKVLYRLHRSGYRSYLCGGSVRDLLMRRIPKDFDVATDAHPNDIRRLFRNSRIIGRRFRLVHIMFQEGFVEVSTFRREPQIRQANSGEEPDLLVTDDNVFGTPEEDARRRDFTVNGLFYNIADFTVIDYVGGLDDLDAGLIRVIGDPAVRFREDPVRMMRAVEFASRLDFQIESKTYESIIEHRAEILKASPARVAEEMLELLRRGWSLGAFRMLFETKLLDPLLPELFKLLAEEQAPYFWKMLEVLDRTVNAGKKVSDAVLFSVLIMPYVMEQIDSEENSRAGRMRTGEVLLYIRELIQPICGRLTFAPGMRHQVEQALETVWRLLEPPTERRSMWRVAFREPFNDALALLELYALSSRRHTHTFSEWQRVANRIRREEHDSERDREKKKPRPRRRRGRGRAL